MYIIVGLGNPGDKYAHTRHNAGFDVLALLADRLGARFDKLRCKARVAETHVGGERVIRVRDYLDGSINVLGLGKVDKTPYYGSNVLYFELADGSIFIVRPSGTEPKIKVYLQARGGSAEDCAAKIAR